MVKYGTYVYCADPASCFVYVGHSFFCVVLVRGALLFDEVAVIRRKY